MIKKDIVERIAAETGLNKAMVRLIIEKFLKEMRASLFRMERVELRNFGVFRTKKHLAKKGRNMKTGETIPVPERWKIHFKPSRIFRAMNSRDSKAGGLFDMEERE